MLSIPQLFDKAFKVKSDRNWEKIFVLVDIHDTIVKADYVEGINNLQFYPNSIEALEELSFRKDVSLILWSSCSIEKLEEYRKEFIKHGHIIFDHLNANPEVENVKYACFDKKPYFNIILDDKSGFDGDNDWTMLLNYLKQC